ncbi:MAG: GIY-YIG nuclease family protein, partial [Pedobacter sp.]
KKHKIAKDLLFDAQGNALSDDLKAEMSANNKVIAYNASGFNGDENFNIQSISGDWLEADTSKVAIALRENNVGYVYLAGSRKGGLIKVGSSNDKHNSIKGLNLPASRSAGLDDWELLFDVKTKAMGKLERLIQQELAEFKADYPHEKIAKTQNAAELYRCSYDKARAAFSELESDESIGMNQFNEKKHLISGYQFRNLKAQKNTSVEA